jgi:hypothetical protein
MAPADVITHQDTPVLWRKELEGRREVMAQEANRLGSQLAAAPPAWADALGPVPSDTVKQQQWRDLAVEVKTFRDTYRIPETETTVLPAEYSEKGTGAELAARVTAMHKYSAQTAKEPLSAADAAHMADAADVGATVATEPTPAEQVVDRLREERSQDVTLTPEQERAERVASMVRRVRENREARQGAPSPEQAPEAVSEALKDIAARRKAEETTAEQAQESLKDRLAKARREREAARAGAPNAGDEIRAVQEEKVAQEAKRRTGLRGPSAAPEHGRRGPRL